ncbi:MBL fold metallo-hydrolase [Bacillus aquiflavi]|uniref:MBL fold metallo-hydrolase n=2 Tax=Bacillus aquiflavi TaxID=2672567 RepID=A0A6B3VY61_9BACI|nr:MBL fold metallo-hydrolase [Bacillus aquiflavi]NEY82238.1 MBL fold metallo-hydrolase [Bacillus aquiflavi]UAC50031.1 MBL fold metallo-hydrolase [Bacillus aquiflavi]
MKLFQTGYCVNLERMVLRGGSFKKVSFPALVALMTHPKYGHILFDTGYASHFFTASRSFPYSIYPKMTPIHFQDGDGIKDQLAKEGISSDDISYIFISHFHGDHLGGLLDFPTTTFLCSKKAYEFVKGKKGIDALKNAFLPELLPKDFEQRVIYIDEEKTVSLPEAFSPFKEGWDVFHDGSFFAVDLTGHAIGQLGLFLHDEVRGEVFLCADACWQSQAFRESVLPSKLAYLMMPDIKSFKKNLKKIHELQKQNNNILILPTHCTEIWGKSYEYS